MDHALKRRQALIASAKPKLTAEQQVDEQIQRLADDLDAKRIRAINQMGSKWMFHPDYDSRRNAHHSPVFKESAVMSMIDAHRKAREFGRTV